MKYIVIYNKANGGQTQKVYTNTKDAFNMFWKQKGGHSPLITSDDLMGVFSFRNIQGFKSTEDGKKFAYLTFLEYVKDMKR
ncbi:MAG: hypothetical protein WCX79_00155 [Candidatus Paceibacterota bacterium]|jgi:hypothetical protein